MGFHADTKWGRLWSQHPPEPTTCPEHVGANSGATSLEWVKPKRHPLPVVFPPHREKRHADVAEQSEGVREAVSVFIRGREAEGASEGQDPRRVS